MAQDKVFARDKQDYDESQLRVAPAPSMLEDRLNTDRKSVFSMIQENSAEDEELSK